GGCAIWSFLLFVVGLHRGGEVQCRALAERWNGRKWRIQQVSRPAKGGAFLFGVSCPSSSWCTAVGLSNRGSLAERWNGRRWRIQPTPNPAGSQNVVLNGVGCYSGSACTAVGGYG